MIEKNRRNLSVKLLRYCQDTGMSTNDLIPELGNCSNIRWRNQTFKNSEGRKELESR